VLQFLDDYEVVDSVLGGWKSWPRRWTYDHWKRRTILEDSYLLERSSVPFILSVTLLY